jgi:hypothetical protein
MSFIITDGLGGSALITHGYADLEDIEPDPDPEPIVAVGGAEYYYFNLKKPIKAPVNDAVEVLSLDQQFNKLLLRERVRK